ncbi:probable protein phosphatase 2C 10 isoform X3 [Vigna angularis]|nr:probable protein phosphatase 2C 10 isoform X3 [Vigna angularis]
MEDYHVAKFVEFNGRELGLFAIYDGHLGDSVPAYLQKHLFPNILKEEDFWNDPFMSISNAYVTTDQEILSHSPDLGRGGSTAVTAILINNQKLWVANVGDSRAVVSRGGEAAQMTTDHEPNTERGSIETRGGFVSNMPGDVARVNGQLAVSRAFGDKNLKTHLRSDPDIQYADITPDVELLILASDGLWKVDVILFFSIFPLRQNCTFHALIHLEFFISFTSVLQQFNSFLFQLFSNPKVCPNF